VTAAGPDFGVAHLLLRGSTHLVRITLFWRLLAGFAFALMLVIAGCGSSGLEPGAIARLSESYNYSPSVIQDGNLLQVWWCGQSPNPTNNQQNTDTVLYETYDPVRKQASKPVVTLAETAGAWDQAFTCNPKVVKGVFTNPLGDDQTYTYELFYVGTPSYAGEDNSIGIAFSNDGIGWKKYPHPIIYSNSVLLYGVGQPAPYNADGKSAIVLFYEDNTPTIHHVKATSTDGVHFTVDGTLTMKGLDPNNPNPSWGDMGFDPSTRYWYGAFQLGVRPAPITGGYQEHGQYGIQIFRIPDDSLLTGDTPWQLVRTIDTNSTGYESNFLPSLAKDGFGNIVAAAKGNFQIYPSISDPAPSWDASPEDAGKSGNLYKWVIGSMQWDPNQQVLPLTRYRNSTAYNVTTGWVAPDADFKVDAALGHLYENPQDGADTPFYACKNGSTGFFVSLDPSCEGQRILGLEGYGYAHPVAGKSLDDLYRCTSSKLGQFASHDAQCEGQGSGKLLGYTLP
jgi:hypothetical protein